METMDVTIYEHQTPGIENGVLDSNRLASAA